MQKKLRKIPTPQGLTNVALHYLGCYAASEASLRRVLTNRLRRAAMDHPEFTVATEPYRALLDVIEKIIASHKRSGALNDVAFAEIKVNSLRRQGRSRRVIQQKLGIKGVSGDIVVAALERNADGAESDEVELKAAMALARRRKWGPFRKTVVDDDRKRKDFAALARAGFSSGIARRVLQAEAPEEWD